MSVHAYIYTRYILPLKKKQAKKRMHLFNLKGTCKKQKKKMNKNESKGKRSQFTELDGT